VDRDPRALPWADELSPFGLDNVRLQLKRVGLFLRDISSQQAQGDIACLPKREDKAVTMQFVNHG